MISSPREVNPISHSILFLMYSPVVTIAYKHLSVFSEILRDIPSLKDILDAYKQSFSKDCDLEDAFPLSQPVRAYKRPISPSSSSIFCDVIVRMSPITFDRESRLSFTLSLSRVSRVNIETTPDTIQVPNLTFPPIYICSSYLRKNIHERRVISTSEWLKTKNPSNNKTYHLKNRYFL